MFRTATTFTRTRISTPGSSDPGESGSMNVILPPQRSSPSTPSAPGGRMLIASPEGTSMPS